MYGGSSKGEFQDTFPRKRSGMASCLVVGGAGFLGSHLVENLVARGYQVRVLDDFRAGSPDNLTAVRSQIDLFHGDLAEPKVIALALAGVDYVFQFATEGPPEFASGPAHCNCAADIVHLLHEARAQNVQRVIYASSGDVYGPLRVALARESDAIMPLTAYAVAKMIAEHHCVACGFYSGLHTVRLRYFEVFGPRQSLRSPHAPVIPKIITHMLAGKSPLLPADAHLPRDYLYVDDAVHAAVLALETRRAAGNVYNIGAGRAANLFQVVDTLNEILGTRIEPRCASAPSREAPPPGAHILRAESQLGFCPLTSLRQGLLRCVAYYERHGQRELAPTSV
jgi:UDP-glucose 4-epimerase